MRRDKNNFITSARKSDAPKKPQEFVTVIILGENYGYRMKSYGPVPLINLNGKLLIEKQINAVKSTFVNYEIIICTGFDSDKISTLVRNRFSSDNIRIVENQIHLNSNCCESVRLCLNNTFNDRVIIIGGGSDIVPQHLELIDLKTTSVMVQPQSSDDNFELGSVISDSGDLGHLSFGIKSPFWTEILYLGGSKVIGSLQKILSGTEYKNKFLFEAINVLANRHEIKAVMNDNKKIMKIDNLKVLRRTIKI
jgi:hypothetical protein